MYKSVDVREGEKLSTVINASKVIQNVSSKFKENRALHKELFIVNQTGLLKRIVLKRRLRACTIASTNDWSWSCISFNLIAETIAVSALLLEYPHVPEGLSKAVCVLCIWTNPTLQEAGRCGKQLWVWVTDETQGKAGGLSFHLLRTLAMKKPGGLMAQCSLRSFSIMSLYFILLAFRCLWVVPDLLLSIPVWFKFTWSVPGSFTERLKPTKLEALFIFKKNPFLFRSYASKISEVLMRYWLGSSPGF